MVSVGKHLVLHRQERAARVDQVDAGQAILGRDLLRAQVLLHRQRIIGAALDRGVVDDDDAFGALDAADAGDDAGRGDVAAIHVPCRELADFEKGRAGVEKLRQPFARQQLAAPDMALARLVGAAARDGGGLVGNIGDQRLHAFRIGREGFGGGGELRLDDGH
jgi:hypothetical protein